MRSACARARGRAQCVATTRVAQAAAAGSCQRLAVQALLRSHPSRAAFSTSSADSGGASAESGDAARRAAASAASNIEAGVEELKSRFSGSSPALLFMTDYYKHRQHKYTVPALSLLLEDERQAKVPTLAVKNAVFFSSVLRGLPGDIAATYCAALTLVPGLPMEVLLAIVHGTGTPVSKAVYDRLGASIRRSGQRELMAAAQYITTVPVSGGSASAPAEVGASSWPAPWDDRHGMGGGAWAAGEAWRTPNTGVPYPWEVLPALARLREDREGVTFHDWLLLSSTTHLEAQWAEFYATGSPRALDNIISTAVRWGEFAPTVAEPMALITDVSRSLPEDLTGPGKEPNATSAAAARAVRAVVSRAALWSLLTFSRRHAAVGEGIARACVPLGRWLMEPAVREAEEAAAEAAGVGLAYAGPDLSEEEAKLRLDVLPGVLHLMASLRAGPPGGGSGSSS